MDVHTTAPSERIPLVMGSEGDFRGAARIISTVAFSYPMTIFEWNGVAFAAIVHGMVENGTFTLE